MASTIQLSRNVRQNLAHLPLRIEALHFLITASDTAANNPLTQEIAASLAKSHTATITFDEFPAELNIPHDMIDPSQPHANTEIAYKKVLELLDMNDSTSVE
jgi:hypothetical protein